MLAKMVERVYIYGDGTIQVVFVNDDYFQVVCAESMRVCKSVKSSNDLTGENG